MARLYISRVIIVNNCTLLASDITPKTSSDVHERGNSDTSRLLLLSVSTYMKGTSFNLLSRLHIIYNIYLYINVNKRKVGRLDPTYFLSQSILSKVNQVCTKNKKVFLKLRREKKTSIGEIDRVGLLGPTDFLFSLKSLKSYK